VLGTACRAVTTDDGRRAPSPPARDTDPRPGGTDDGATGAQRLPAEDDDAVAALAAWLLSADVSAAVIEVDTTGPSLTGRARDALSAALAQHGNKDITLAPEGNAPRKDVYTTSDLRRISGATRETFSSTDRMSVHVLVLDGRYEDDDAIGVAFEATSFAIFPDRIRSGVLSSVNYDRFEEAVVVHELGHLLGLVNLTSDGAFHEDPEHPGHSRNSESAMYWAVEDISVGNVFRGGPPTTFDADDVEEMSRIRG
jgi:hypothetical protein